MADTDYPASWYAATRDSTPRSPAACGQDRGGRRGRGRRLCRPAHGAAAGDARAQGRARRAPAHRLGRLGPQWRLRRRRASPQRSGGADREARAGPCAPALRPVAARRGDRARGHRRSWAGPTSAWARASSRSRAPTRARASPSARARWRKSSAPASSRGRPTRVRALLATARYHQAIHDAQAFPHPSAQLRAGAGRPTSNDAAAGARAHASAVGLERQRRRVAAADGRRRDRGAPCRAGRQRRSRPRAAAHRARRAAGGDLCRGDGQDRPAARRGHPLDAARSPTRAAPATTTASSTATACCGAAASPPTRASRRGCAR